MFNQDTHFVREDEEELEVMVMCSVPSEDPFTLVVHPKSDTAIG